MRFCPQCGAPLLAGAKFCVECGRALDVAAPGAGESGASSGQPRESRAQYDYDGVRIRVRRASPSWVWRRLRGSMMKTPEVVREQVATAPPAAATHRALALPLRSRQRAAPAQNAAANPAAGGSQNGGLPPGHPTIELPTEARSFVDKIERDANAKPKDVAAWNKFGAVSMRAAMFDQTYYGKAEDAYGHVLKLDPDNLDALRGIGDIDYDKQHYDEAIAAYEHYLKKKPDDPEVRTDLGTMYLYTGNADQAVVQYKKAIASKPGFFQAYYNMGIAYAQENKPDDAAATLKQAIALAPDDTARDQVKAAAGETQRRAGGGRVECRRRLRRQRIRRPRSRRRQRQESGGEFFGRVSRESVGVAGGRARPSAEDDFHDAVEEMVRGLPIAGPKVTLCRMARQAQGQSRHGQFPDGSNAAVCENQIRERHEGGNRQRQERQQHFVSGRSQYR